MSCQSAMIKPLVQTSSLIRSISHEYFGKHLCTTLMKTTLVFRICWSTNNFSQKKNHWTNRWISKSSFKRDFLSASLSCMFANNRSIPQLLPATFRQDPIGPEKQKYLSPRSSLSAIPLVSDRYGVDLFKRMICMNNTWSLILRHDLLETLHRLLRSFVLHWLGLNPMRVKVLYHD